MARTDKPLVAVVLGETQFHVRGVAYGKTGPETL